MVTLQTVQRLTGVIHPLFFDIRALWRSGTERQSARMSKNLKWAWVRPE